MARLWWEALRIRVVNSVGARSAIERRCLGAKGEVDGVDELLERNARQGGLHKVCCIRGRASIVSIV
jgi:hypothetical protein